MNKQCNVLRFWKFHPLVPLFLLGSGLATWFQVPGFLKVGSFWFRLVSSEALCDP